VRSRALAWVRTGLFAFVGATVSVFPTSLARDPALASRPVHPAPSSRSAALIRRVEGELRVRAAALPEADRARLARTVVLEAEAARLDPLLVLALIEVESSFRPGALSQAGAKGLMQLREPTLRRELERSGITYQDPHDPVVNVQAGVRYLRRLMDAFGREELALMAYNAGPNRILGYLREGEIPDRFHAYPRRVRAEMRRLRRTLGSPARAPTPTLAASRAATVGE
jgi:soluble lytic murein transglycosylase-like protein